MNPKNYSEDTARKIDEEISRFLETARDAARKMLENHKDKFELVAQTLLQQETIEQHQFAEMMG